MEVIKPQTVYILLIINKDGDQVIENVFSTYSSAKAYVNTNHLQLYCIEEWEVDE